MPGHWYGGSVYVAGQRILLSGVHPANLGLASYQMRGLQLFGAGFSIKNNSFSLDDYNTYTGARLNEQEKQELLSKIRPKGCWYLPMVNWPCWVSAPDNSP